MFKKSFSRKWLWVKNIAVSVIFTIFAAICIRALIVDPFVEMGVNLVAVFFTASGAIYGWIEVAKLIRQHYEQTKKPSEKKSKSSRRFILKVIFITVTALVIIGAILLLVDYKRYQEGGRSVVFGTLDTYNQNQVLHIGSLDVGYVNVVTTEYDKDALLAEYNGCVEEQNGMSFTFLCTAKYAPADNPTEFAENYKQIQVNFLYGNTSDTPIKFNTRNYDLLINTPKYNFFRECDYQWSENVIKGSTQYSCIRADISKDYYGPLNLEITLNGQAKRIVITDY